MTAPAGADGVPDGWDDLVTLALLGTDRRAAPAAEHADPARTAGLAVLERAARRWAVNRAGAPAEHCPAPALAPAGVPPRAPDAAQDLLAALLATPEPTLVNVWLSACDEGGWSPADEYWPRLAAVTTRSPAYDRGLLHGVLGPRGRWFLGQHPQWRGLLSSPSSPDGAGPDAPEPGATYPAVAGGLVTRALASGSRGSEPDLPVRAVQAVLSCPDPWPPALVSSAVALVASGVLGADTRRWAGLLAVRIPLGPGGTEEQPAVPGPSDATVSAASGAARLGLGLVQRTLVLRREVERAFGPDPTSPDPPSPDPLNPDPTVLDPSGPAPSSSAPDTPGSRP